MITELYMIYDVTNNNQIMNARGGAYSNLDKALVKMTKLARENPDNFYILQIFRINGSIMEGKLYEQYKSCLQVLNNML